MLRVYHSAQLICHHGVVFSSSSKNKHFNSFCELKAEVGASQLRSHLFDPELVFVSVWNFTFHSISPVHACSWLRCSVHIPRIYLAHLACSAPGLGFVSTLTWVTYSLQIESCLNGCISDQKEKKKHWFP